MARKFRKRGRRRFRKRGKRAMKRSSVGNIGRLTHRNGLNSILPDRMVTCMKYSDRLDFQVTSGLTVIMYIEVTRYLILIIVVEAISLVGTILETSI